MLINIPKKKAVEDLMKAPRCFAYLDHLVLAKLMLMQEYDLALYFLDAGGCKDKALISQIEVLHNITFLFEKLNKMTSFLRFL